jgi:hypothetical protein
LISESCTPMHTSRLHSIAERASAYSQAEHVQESCVHGLSSQPHRAGHSEDVRAIWQGPYSLMPLLTRMLTWHAHVGGRQLLPACQRLCIRDHGASFSFSWMSRLPSDLSFFPQDSNVAATLLVEKLDKSVVRHRTIR